MSENLLKYLPKLTPLEQWQLFTIINIENKKKCPAEHLLGLYSSKLAVRALRNRCFSSPWNALGWEWCDQMAQKIGQNFWSAE